jgi:hypothetical protein
MLGSINGSGSQGNRGFARANFCTGLGRGDRSCDAPVEKHRVNPSANGHHYPNPSLLLISSVLSVIRKIPIVVRDNDFCYVFFFKRYLFTISNPRNKLRFNNRLVITRAVPQYDRSNLATHASFWL